jgi:hypothetical protein
LVSDNLNAKTRWLFMKLAYVWILAAFMAPLVFAAMPSASESVNAKALRRFSASPSLLDIGSGK